MNARAVHNTRLRPCPSCGNGVAKSATACPRCGQRLKGGVWHQVLRGILFALLLLVLLSVFSGGCRFTVYPSP